MLKEFYPDEDLDFIMYDENIISKINEYNEIVNSSIYKKCQIPINEKIYKELIVSNIVTFLLGPIDYIVPKVMYSILDKEIKKCYKISINDIKKLNEIEKKNLKVKLEKKVFSNENINVIKEISYIDIVQSENVEYLIDKYKNRYNLSQKITEQMTYMTTLIEMETFDMNTFFSKCVGNSLPKSIVYKKYNSIVDISKAINQHYTLVKNYSFEPCISIKKDNSGINYLLDSEKAQLATVRIETERTTGTGFLISKKGHIVTCEHVISHSEEISCVLIDESGLNLHDVKILYKNKGLDLAICQIDCVTDYFFDLETENALPDLGEQIVVFGYPLGNNLGRSNFFGSNISILKGYVSSNQLKNGKSISYIDVPVNFGSSGSPVISLKTGKVIGIVSAEEIDEDFYLEGLMPHMIPIQYLNKLFF